MGTPSDLNVTLATRWLDNLTRFAAAEPGIPQVQLVTVRSNVSPVVQKCFLVLCKSYHL